MKMATYGTCDRLRVGAVFYNSDKILGCGFNHQPRNQFTSRYSCDRDGHMVNENGGCIATVHAEMDALVNAIRQGNSVYQQKLFITHMPCYYCAKILVELGITSVTYISNYESKSSYGSGEKLLIKYHVSVSKYKINV